MVVSRCFLARLLIGENVTNDVLNDRPYLIALIKDAAEINPRKLGRFKKLFNDETIKSFDALKKIYRDFINTELGKIKSSKDRLSFEGVTIDSLIKSANLTTYDALKQFAYLGIDRLIDLVLKDPLTNEDLIPLGLEELQNFSNSTFPVYPAMDVQHRRTVLLQKQELQLLRNLNDVNIKNCKFKQETAVEENVASKNDTEMTFEISHLLAAVRSLGLTEQARNVAKLLLTSAELSDEDRELIEEQLTVINDTLSTE